MRKKESLKGVSLMKTSMPEPGLCEMSARKKDDALLDYTPFLMDGLVSLTDGPGLRKPVKILRDTGAALLFWSMFYPYLRNPP